MYCHVVSIRRVIPSGLGLSAALTLALLTGTAQGEDAPPAMEKITYDDHVKPILRDNCFLCHNQNMAKSDLALDSYATMMRGGASGEVVMPGDLDNSRLWLLVSHQDTPEMPPEKEKLAEATLDTIRKWIEGGALENTGSSAKVKAKPKLGGSVVAGSARPEGPAAMPSGLSRQPLVTSGRAGAATAMATSPWAPLIALGGQKQILLYNSDTGLLLGVLPFPEGIPHVLKFSRSGTLLLAGGGRGGQSGRVVVFDVVTGNRVYEIGEELDVVLAADINEDHTKIALGGPGKIVRVYSTEDGSLLYELKKHTEWILSLEFSPDGVLLATSDRNGGVFVWEAETAREYLNLKGHESAVWDVSWQLDANVLATAGEDGTVRLWAMEGGGQLKSVNAHGGGVMAVRHTHDGRLLTTGRDRVTKMWDASGNLAKEFEAFGDIGLEATFTHDGAKAVAGDVTGDVRMWNVADGARLANLTLNPPTLEVLAQQLAAEAAAAKTAADAAAAELAALKQTVTEKIAAAQAMTEAAAKAQQSATDAQTAQAAAEKSAADTAALLKSLTDALASLQAALEKATAEKTLADNVLAERTKAAQTAAGQAAAAKASADAILAEQAAIEKALAEKDAAARAAADKAAATKAAADSVAQEQAAAAANSAPEATTAQAAVPQS